MTRARVLFLAERGQALAPRATVDDLNRPGVTDELPIKSWSLDNDALNVADCLSFTVDNADGRNRGKIQPLDLIRFDVADDTVAGGQWVPQFTGRIITAEYSADETSGSEITFGCYDLGWHLTSCDAQPLLRTEGGTLADLVRKLVDPSWGFPASVQTTGPVLGNAANRRISQGRAGIVRSFQALQTRGLLPFFQVEPGQKPWQTLQEYCARAGVLVGVGAEGDLILFRPDYSQDVPYSGIELHPVGSASSRRNNVRGRAVLRMDGGGVYSESQCWTTVVIPNRVQSAESAVENNPNALRYHETFKLDPNPLPFTRRLCFEDSEAVNRQTALRRAIWRLQMELFNAWSYECTVEGHAQNGAFFTTDAVIPVHDEVNGVDDLLYVQKCKKSFSETEGATTSFVLRYANLLNPSLTEITSSSGARKSKAPQQVQTKKDPVAAAGDATVEGLKRLAPEQEL